MLSDGEDWTHRAAAGGCAWAERLRAASSSALCVIAGCAAQSLCDRLNYRTCAPTAHAIGVVIECEHSTITGRPSQLSRRTFWKAMHAGGAPRVLHGACSVCSAITRNYLSNLFATLALMRRPSKRRHAHVALDLDQRRKALLISDRDTMQCDTIFILQRGAGMRPTRSTAASACHERLLLSGWSRRGRSAVCSRMIRAYSEVLWLRGREVITAARSSSHLYILAPPRAPLTGAGAGAGDSTQLGAGPYGEGGIAMSGALLLRSCRPRRRRR